MINQLSQIVTDRKGFIAQFVLPVLFSCLLGLSAVVKIPLGFTPVPISLQPHLILFASILLGRQGALIAVGGLFLQGLLGLPVFSAGSLLALGPTAGYLLVYLISPYIVSYLYENLKIEGNQLRAFASMGICAAILLSVGGLWLANYVGIKSAFMMGVAPFIIGDLFKLTLFSKLVKSSN